MNYRHSYHAGNFADVLKHTVLALILDYLCRKPAPYMVLDTHAGTGVYDLAAPQSQRTGEYQHGITRLWAPAFAWPAGLLPYRAALLAAQVPPLSTHAASSGGGAGVWAGDVPRYYPGSPAIARHFLRPQDRLLLNEYHPEDARQLKRSMAGQRQIAVHSLDGYRTLKAFLPPPERRGLVLIDPPFEQADEWAQLVAALVTGYRRWPTGIYALWYPIKERAAVWRFQEALERTAIPRQLMVELTVHPENDHTRLNGCGMLLVNPPWQLDETLAALLPVLHCALAVAGAGSTRVEWLVPETVSAHTETRT